jgi:predicted MFS family arabinose efflux permease
MMLNAKKEKLWQKDYIIMMIAACGISITTHLFSYLLIPFMRSLTPLLILAFPIGLSIGAITPLINGLIFRRCSPYRKGTASAAYFSAIDIGIGVGSIAFGFVISAISYRFMYFSASFFCILALLIYIFFIAGKEKRVLT